ncbi:hypothetical protein ASG31_12130 [Chryseobacterium sp. Leaf404]|uniref:hypothetical protein n=1 Tax=unclassified Chryseobacterium TaxID=2593645 RepID=UPI0006FB796F|nr:MULTISPECIES: hypothetical protein [unclassified Chryseobacterium]KQT17091.1 hypothetical protein ASG31_12130 [Chryseobacterium sp. Leaf404]
MDNTLTQEIIKIFIDKGIMAILILFIAFRFNKMIEKIKTSNTEVLDLKRQKSILENDLLKDKRFRKLSFLERQLSEFYWPIYIRLQKDTILFEKIPNFFSDHNTLPIETNDYLENEVILKNHNEIVEIIESKFHLAEADEILSNEFLKYIKHVTTYQAIRKISHFNHRNPIDFNEPYPPNFNDIFAENLKKIQTKYNNLVEEIKGDV